MSTTSPAVQPAGSDDASLERADTALALEQFAKGRPLDPGLVKRLRARAEQVTAGVRRDHGLVDDDTFQSLLDDEA